jgi:hypothetical protein
VRKIVLVCWHFEWLWPVVYYTIVFLSYKIDVRH